MAHCGEKHLLIALCICLFSKKKKVEALAGACVVKLSSAGVEAVTPEKDLRDLKGLTSSARQLEIPALLLRVPRESRGRACHYREIIYGCVLG